MSSVSPFSFNAVKSCFVIINGKPWTRAKEVYMTLEYKKGRSRDILKKLVTIENKQRIHELEERAAVQPVDWPKNSQPDKYYINEDGMHEL